MFFVFLVFNCFSESDPGLKEYLTRVIPKVLYFDKISGDFEITSTEERDGGKGTVTGRFGNRIISAEFGKTNNEFEIDYVSADDVDGWSYVRATDVDNLVAIHYMRMMVNSIVPPNIVRALSHREKRIDGEMHHQMTFIMEISGHESVQFVEWKYYKDEIKHTFIDHAVIAKEGETL